MQAQGGTARPLFRARARRRRDRPDDLRQEQRLLRRPNREEAPEPLPPGLVGSLFRHGRMQPRLPVLPELGHLEVPADRHPRGFRIPRAHRPSAVALGCRSVAFTYNDPVVFMEYAIDGAQACREEGIKSVAVTAGYMSPAPRAELYRYMDAANVDLKAFTEDFYQKFCGARLGPVLETLEYLRHETDVWFEITTLLIPGLNDSDEEIDAMTRWVADRLGPDVPLHFTAFHPDWKM